MVGIIERISERLSRGLWRARSLSVAKASIPDLRHQQTQAQRLRRDLDVILREADQRLTLPRIGSNLMEIPHNSDWSWRPPLWRNELAEPGAVSLREKADLGENVTLFHNCKRSEIIFAQRRNTCQGDLAPFGVVLEVLQFDGTYLSIAVACPDAAVDGLGRHHIVRVEMTMEQERAQNAHMRLNIRHGPNTETLKQQVYADEKGRAVVEFDLAYCEINEKRVEHMWLDVLYDNPAMNRFAMRDLVFCRFPRAEI